MMTDFSLLIVSLRLVRVGSSAAMIVIRRATRSTAVPKKPAARLDRSRPV